MIDDLLSRDEVAAIAILILGAIVARLASTAVGWLLGWLERRTARLATSDKVIITPSLVRVTRAVVFWLVLILAVSYALRLLDVGSISTLLLTVSDFIPQLMVGFAIVVAGHVLGLVASHLVAELGAGLSAESLGPRLMHGAIVVVAVVIGLKHVGVDISFITQLILVAFAVTGSGLMLAFALGARQHVANLLARRGLSHLAVGDRIRVDDIEGELVALHGTRIDVATDDGIVSIPAARLAETPVAVLSGRE